MNEKNPYAVALGRLNRGVPKRITPEDRVKRTARLAEARKLRWPAKQQQEKPV